MRYFRNIVSRASFFKESMPKEPSEWKALLVAHLREANLSSCRARLEWLCSHLDDYLGRFIGFAEQRVPIVKLVQGDLFIVIRVAIEVIEM